MRIWSARASMPALILLALVLSLTVSADTITLKNGRVLRGQVLRFANGEFVVGVERAGSQRQEMILLVDTVASIRFEAAGAAVASERMVVLDASKEVVSTGVQVRRGERVLVTASGQMQFADGRVSSPAGLDSTESWPFPGEKTGVLVALVGDANSSVYHVIGERAEFEARSDGEVLLQVNAASLKGARGAYTARLSTPGGSSATGLWPASREPARSTPTSEGPRQLRYQIEVPAGQPWTDTGIDLLEGDTLRLEAQGTINYTSSKTTGPEGASRGWRDLLRALPVNDAGRGALIGLVGQTGAAQAFYVGAQGEFVVDKTGRLFLGINDEDYGNNKGGFQVTIEIVPARR